MYLVAALLSGLVAFRLWRLVAQDVITDPLRVRFLWRAQPGPVRGWITEMVMCVWCLGFWLAGAAAAYSTWVLELDWRVFPLLWCTASAIAGLTERAASH